MFEDLLLQLEGSALQLIGVNPSVALITKKTYERFKEHNAFILMKHVSGKCFVDFTAIPLKHEPGKFYLFAFHGCCEYVIVHEDSAPKIRELTELDDDGLIARLYGDTSVCYYTPGEKLSNNLLAYNFIILGDDSYDRARLMDDSENTKNAFGIYTKK